MRTDNLANSSHFTIMSVIKRKCTHAVPPSLSSRSNVCVCVFSAPSCGQAGAGGSPGVAAEALGNWLWPFTPLLPSHPSSPPSLPPDLHTYITPNWSSRRQLANAWGRGAIIHVAQPLMQICLHMKAFWARRTCFMAMLWMSATWPRCLLALSMRSRVRFSFLLSVFFMTWSKDNKLSGQSCHLH